MCSVARGTAVPSGSCCKVAPSLEVGLELGWSWIRVTTSLEVGLELGLSWIRVTPLLGVGLGFGWSCCRVAPSLEVGLELGWSWIGVAPSLEVMMEFGWSWVGHCWEELSDSLGRATGTGGFVVLGCFGLVCVGLFCWELMVKCRSYSSTLFDSRLF